MTSKRSPWGWSGGPPKTILNNEQLERLKNVGATVMQFHPKNGRPSPPISVGLFFGVEELVATFRNRNIPIGGVCLVGGAASFIVNPRYTYNDVDIVFILQPILTWTKKQENDAFRVIKKIVYGWLGWCMIQSELDADDVALQSSFVAKQFRLFSTEENTDSWSLFSFNNEKGMNLELKFVLRMKRDYQFATDSLKIDILSFFQKKYDVPITSSFGDIPKIMELLEHRRIDTKNPEEIVGGGLLKYCLLKFKGFEDARKDQELQKLIHAMLNGFLTLWKKEAEFKTPQLISKFLENHFPLEAMAQKTKFLDLVEALVMHVVSDEVRFHVQENVHMIKQQLVTEAENEDEDNEVLKNGKSGEEDRT